MEPVVIACGGCGMAIRIRHPEIARRRVCPRCRTDLTRDQDRACRQSLARLTGILVAALFLATGAMLGVLTIRFPLCRKPCPRRVAASRTGQGPTQLAPASALPPSATLLAMRITTHEGDDEKIRRPPSSPPNAGRSTECNGRSAASVIGPEGTTVHRAAARTKAVRPVSDRKGMTRNGDPAAAEPQRAIPVLVELAAAPAAGLAQAPPAAAVQGERGAGTARGGPTPRSA